MGIENVGHLYFSNNSMENVSVEFVYSIYKAPSIPLYRYSDYETVLPHLKKLFFHPWWTHLCASFVLHFDAPCVFLFELLE